MTEVPWPQWSYFNQNHGLYLTLNNSILCIKPTQTSTTGHKMGLFFQFEATDKFSPVDIRYIRGSERQSSHIFTFQNNKELNDSTTVQLVQRMNTTNNKIRVKLSNTTITQPGCLCHWNLIRGHAGAFLKTLMLLYFKLNLIFVPLPQPVLSALSNQR